MGRWLRALWIIARSLSTAGVGCEQCVLRRKILGLGLGGPCTPPHKSLKSVVDGVFSICFDTGLGWGSIPGVFGKDGGLPVFGVGWEKHISNAVRGRKAWRIMHPTRLIVRSCQ